eukprot:scaffold25790_cov59-Phaeocystis_antarctica.AAC.3
MPSLRLLVALHTSVAVFGNFEQADVQQYLDEWSYLVEESYSAPLPDALHPSQRPRLAYSSRPQAILLTRLSLALDRRRLRRKGQRRSPRGAPAARRHHLVRCGGPVRVRCQLDLRDSLRRDASHGRPAERGRTAGARHARVGRNHAGRRGRAVAVRHGLP